MNTTFKLLHEFGDHKILNYNISNYDFNEYFMQLFNTDNLDNLHLKSSDYMNNMFSDISEYETDLHKIFYKDIKTNSKFKHLYCSLIKDIHKTLYPDETVIIYQSFPSVRFQFPNNVAIPPHCDSDDIGKHPIGEINFLLPITKMFGSKTLFIESKPNKGDFIGIELNYGNLFKFNGNKCIHYNIKNTENTIRISLDFRIMLINDYYKYIMNGSLTTTNPRDPLKIRKPIKMIVGGYYQMTYINDTIEQMMIWKFQNDLLLQSRPNFDENEALACYEYMKNPDNFVTEYKQTEILENMLAQFIGSKYCVMTTSGTSAIILALLSLDIGIGCDVIVPNYTMIATINAIKFVGAKPIIIDVDQDTFTISIDDIVKNITPNTKAIMHVSLNNRHKNISEIVNYCNNNNIHLIEDSAQSLGCFVNGHHFGTFGKIGCFSLSTPKIISTGQGGFIVTNDEEIVRKIIMIKNFGRKQSGIDIFETFGLNLKFTDVQAVIGIEQVKKLPARVIRMREIFDQYYSLLSEIPQIKIIPPQSNEWIPWFVDIFVENRDELMLFLKHHNIQTRATYPEINKTPMYLNNETHFTSQYVSNHGLFLPTHTLLTNDQIIHVCKIIKLYYTR